MKRIQMAALVSFVVISAVAPALVATDKNDDKVIQQVKEFRNRYLEAEETKNIPFLQQSLADEVVVFSVLGQQLDKLHLLERIKDPERTFTLLNPRDSHVHLYGNRTVAILTEDVTVNGNDHGRQFAGEFRYVRVFAKQQGKWQVAFVQGTPLPPSSK